MIVGWTHARTQNLCNCTILPTTPVAMTLLRTLAGAGTQRAEGDLKEESGFECLIWLAASVAQDTSGAMHTIDDSDCLPAQPGR